MADKVVKKDVKTEVKTDVKKGRRRLKRSVRKTLGALFLATSIAVAAIPVDGLQAADTANSKPENWGTLEENLGVNRGTYIPYFTDKETKIYTTGDGDYQFAYMMDTGRPVAVLLGYGGGHIENNSLEIPETVDAYANISANLGSAAGYTAVSRSNDFLYYPVYNWRDVDDPINPGQTIREIDPEPREYLPCYYSTRLEWLTYQNEYQKTTGQKRDLSDFYYYPSGDKNSEITRATEEGHQWMQELDVRYIGNQYLKTDEEDNMSWKIDADVDFDHRDKGVFAGKSNIVSLTIHDTLMGIGDYAFYGCAGLSSITLADGLSSIGVGAFANCANMTSVNLNPFSIISVIGDYAFYNCIALRSFTLPVSVTRLGDSVFENCSAMTTFDTKPVGGGDKEEKNCLLAAMGSHVFRGCSSLQSFSVPVLFAETIPICTFEKCSSLKYIEVMNTTIDFTEKCGEDSGHEYTFATFMSEVPSTFYISGAEIRGSENSTLHDTVQKAGIPFYFYSERLEKNVYEKAVTETQEDNTEKKAIYQVDDNNNLVSCTMDAGMTTVTLPETIGPRYISSIGSRTFQDNCTLARITIPSSLESIQADAFKGCHDLKLVTFANGANPTIASGAFKPQDVLVTDDHYSSLTQEPSLFFVGDISYSSKPFMYAMDEANYINNANQQRTYIIYSSGWPTNLLVQYTPSEIEGEEGTNELIGYPTLSALSDNSTYTKYPYVTSDMLDTAASAVKKYMDNLTGSTVSGGNAGGGTLLDAEKAVIDAALNLVIPEGIESFRPNLFVENEGKELTSLKLDKTITAESLKKVEAEAFKGHKNLVSIKLSDATTEIGDHAFEGCEKLNIASLPATVTDMGTAPFLGCSSLSTVNFNGSPYFTCDKSIIYKLVPNTDVKDTLVEVLQGRTEPMISAAEVAGITAISAEAFKGVDLVTVDLSSTEVTTIETETFADMDSLTRVILPKTIRNIRARAFANSPIRMLTIPGEYTNIDPAAFEDVKTDQLTLYVYEGSMADEYGELHGIKRSYEDPEVEHTVRFYYPNEEEVRTLISTQVVLEGQSAVEPEHPTRTDGYVFVRWDTDDWVCVMEDLTVIAVMMPEDEITYIVTYLYDDGTVFTTQTVKKGGDAIDIQPPYKQGYVFIGWKVMGGDGSINTSLKNIQSDVTVMAQYRVAGEGDDDGSGTQTKDPNATDDPNSTNNPNNTNDPNNTNNPNGTNDPNNTNNPNGTNDPNSTNNPNGSATLYTLTVQNGSGSGSYVEGAQPVIIANDPATGQVFDHWSVSPEDVKIASLVLSASVITMPAKDVTVTAHYKAGSGGGGGTGNGGDTGNGNNTQRPNGSVEGTGGTTVVIDKNGLSNTGVVSVTVHGSSDNFTIKISDTNEATEAALRALMAEYGDDLSNIRYFPMDISLYDSTGTYKITDTTGLSVDVTLPLPDNMITYAGNNKVASTKGGKIERLNARFSTIQGVSCITFTAEHFSPYMIYVDLGNMSSGLVSDDTPKTGDGIHPKWFLSIGLACLSLVFFMQKDNRKQPKKVKVKVRAR